jgi:hypothetical protein
VQVPIRVVDEGGKADATFHYSIGAFVGRDTPLTLGASGHAVLRFRIPQELFRSRERFVVEVLAGGSAGPQKVLWAKRWEVAWRGKAPALEPTVE